MDVLRVILSGGVSTGSICSLCHRYMSALRSSSASSRSSSGEDSGAPFATAATTGRCSEDVDWEDAFGGSGLGVGLGTPNVARRLSPSSLASATCVRNDSAFYESSFDSYLELHVSPGSPMIRER